MYVLEINEICRKIWFSLLFLSFTCFHDAYHMLLTPILDGELNDEFRVLFTQCIYGCLNHLTTQIDNMHLVQNIDD